MRYFFFILIPVLQSKETNVFLKSSYNIVIQLAKRKRGTRYMFIKFCKVLTLNKMLQKENNVQELPKKIMVCLPSLNLHGV